MCLRWETLISINATFYPGLRAARGRLHIGDAMGQKIQVLLLPCHSPNPNHPAQLLLSKKITRIQGQSMCLKFGPEQDDLVFQLSSWKHEIKIATLNTLQNSTLFLLSTYYVTFDVHVVSLTSLQSRQCLYCSTLATLQLPQYTQQLC